MTNKYPSLAALRGALTVDDPDERGDAYSAVYEADLKPSQVLDTDPGEEALQALRDTNVIPEDAGYDHGTAAEQRAALLEELRAIREAVNGGGS